MDVDDIFKQADDKQEKVQDPTVTVGGATPEGGSTAQLEVKK